MTSRLGLRGGLRRLGSGLIAYGLVGIVVAAIGFGSLVWVDGRIRALRSEVAASVAQQSAALALAADVLHDAATTAHGFSATVDRTSEAVSSAAGTITGVRAELVALEAQLRSVNILGATPLASPADAVGGIATSMDGLDGQVAQVAEDLKGNRNDLAANATSLDQLSAITGTLSRRLGLGVVEDSLGDLQQLISITLLVFSAWSLVPAIGTLGLGIWLRRQAGGSRSG